ncbi:VOC family protein [Paenibacillus polymyxa]|uniref:VOC domain-containing protein n=1 Tax=Paenibacillus polymyxa TaxID=1406 RepID=A0AAE9IFH1_PAEPO|nr:hypothetical protein [Paenibacillus polymyxa]URJ52736.1 hypothetical protein MF626_002278 [Paenibacillus polymyxa]
MKLKEVLLGTHSFEAMKAFYGSLLDLQVVEEGPSRLSFQVGESVLAFQDSSHMKNEFYHIAFTIPTNKFIEAKQWAIDRGISLISRPQEEDEFFSKTGMQQRFISMIQIITSLNSLPTIHSIMQSLKLSDPTLYFV